MTTGPSTTPRDESGRDPHRDGSGRDSDGRTTESAVSNEGAPDSVGVTTAEGAVPRQVARSSEGAPGDPASEGAAGDPASEGAAGDRSREGAALGKADESAPAEAELANAVAQLAESDLDRHDRAKLLGRIVHSLRGRGFKPVFYPRKAMQWIVDSVSDLAPHIPVRDLETLRRHFPGLDGEQLAERLIRNATRATGGVGAVGGGLASVQWAVPPALLSAPVMLAAETVAVVAIELKLIGELHEVYRHPIPGPGSQKAVSLMQAWAAHRGINPMLPGTGVATVLSTATRKQMRDMLLRRFGRNLTTLGPLLTGAAVATYLNRRATRRLGEDVARDLRLRFGRQDVRELPQ